MLILAIIFNSYMHLITITWARGICLIYMPNPEGHRPKGEGKYIRQILIAHVISNIFFPKEAIHQREELDYKLTTISLDDNYHVIVITQYEYDIFVINRVQGKAKDKC